MRTIEPCRNYLCPNDSDKSDGMCGPCRASERLVAAVNAALVEFLSDRWPVVDGARARRMSDNDLDRLLDSRIEMSERIQRSDAGSDLAQGLITFHRTGCGPAHLDDIRLVVRSLQRMARWPRLGHLRGPGRR